MRRVMLFIPMALLMAVLFLPALCAAQVNGVVYVDALDLKGRIESGERIALLDVRSSGAYDHSDIKIKGAIRIAPDELVERAWELPMGKVIATYCT